MIGDESYLVIMETTEKTHVVKPQPAMDGGMVEMYDLVTGVFVGSCGINWFRVNAVRFDPLGNQVA